MARRKRASMREGPLADLFRSTVDEPSEAETKTEKIDPADTLGEAGPIAFGKHAGPQVSCVDR